MFSETYDGLFPISTSLESFNFAPVAYLSCIPENSSVKAFFRIAFGKDCCRAHPSDSGKCRHSYIAFVFIKTYKVSHYDTLLERHKIIIPRKSFLNAQNCVTKNNVFKVCSKLTKPLMHHTSLPLWRRNAKEEIPGSPRIYTFGGPPSLSSPGRREHKFEDTPGVKGDRKGEKKSRRNFFREIMEFQRKTVFALSFFRISREVFQASTIPVWKGTFQGQTCLLTLGIEATSSSYSSFSFPGHKSNSPSFSLSSVFLGLVTKGEREKGKKNFL